MVNNKPMKISESNLVWLKKLKKRLQLNSCDAALSKIKKVFNNLKLDKEL